jgi:acetyl esterase/lipase
MTCQLAMDIAAPTSGGPWPLIVFLVGGAESPDERYPDIYGPFAEAIAGQGAVVMVTSWRIGVEWGGGYPTSFEDVACAVGVARRIGPDYGANPDQVSLVGSSNGGWPAGVVGLTPSPFTPSPGSCDPTAGSLRPEQVVIMAGAFNYESSNPALLPFVRRFLGGNPKALPDAWAATDEFALAQDHPARAHAIPFLLIQGLADLSSPPADTRSLQAALVAAGYHSELVEIPGVDHLGTWANGDAVDAVMTIVTDE